MDDRTRWLLEAPLNGVLLKLTAPSTLAFAVQSAVTLAEVWFIGQLGTSALAAMALVFPLLMLVQTMSGGALGGAISASIARSLGAGQRDKAEQLIWHALVTALLGALTFLVVFALGGRSLLVMLGGEAQLLDLAADYCWVLFLGGFSVWASSSLGAVFRGMGLMGFSAMIMILGALIQIPLSGGLILGWFGLPQLGLMGAAVSTISVASLMSLLFVLRLMGNSTPAQLKLGQLQLSRPLFEEILKVARPASLSPIFTVATILGLTALVGQFGAAALAGYGIGTRIEFLMIPIVFSMGTALTTIVGTCMGSGNITRAEAAGWIGSVWAGCIAGGVGLVLAIFPEVWIPAFTEDAETFRAAKDYIQIVGPAYAFLGLGLVLYFASQGAAAMTWPILATVLRFAVSVGVAAIWVSVFGGALQVIFTSGAIGMVLFGTLIALGLKLGAWRRGK